MEFSNSKWNGVFWSLVATLVFAALVYFADVNQVLEALASADPLLVLLSIITGLLGMVLWSFNWKNFFEISGIGTGYFRTFQLMAASGFLNLVTPLGQFGGQPVMAYLVSKESDTSYERALATLSSADLIAILPIAVFSTLGLSYLLLTGGFAAEVVTLAALVYLLSAFGLAMGYLGWYRPEILRKILFAVFSKVDHLTGQKSDLVSRIDGFLKSLEGSYREIGESPGKILKSVAIVHVSYLAKFLALYIVMASLGLSITGFEVLLIVSLSVVANFSPTPGGSGTFEAAMSGLILLFVDVDLATAVSAAILYRVSTYWVGVGVGYMAFLSLGVDVDSYIGKDKIQ